MVTNVIGLKKTAKYIELQLNHTINLKIFKKQEKKDSIKFEYTFNRKLITNKEAEEIVNYFIFVEGKDIL